MFTITLPIAFDTYGELYDTLNKTADYGVDFELITDSGDSGDWPDYEFSSESKIMLLLYLQHIGYEDVKDQVVEI